MYLNLNSSVKWEIHAYQPQGVILLKTTSSEVGAKILVPIPEEPAFLEIGSSALFLEIPQNVRIIRNLPVRVRFRTITTKRTSVPHTQRLDGQWTTSSLPLSSTMAPA
jgi:hypothetical protein